MQAKPGLIWKGDMQAIIVRVLLTMVVSLISACGDGNEVDLHQDFVVETESEISSLEGEIKIYFYSIVGAEGAVSVSLSGPDSEYFDIDLEARAWKLATPMDFEAPLDHDLNNVYEFSINFNDDSNAVVVPIKFEVVDKEELILDGYFPLTRSEHDWTKYPRINSGEYVLETLFELDSELWGLEQFEEDYIFASSNDGFIYSYNLANQELLKYAIGDAINLNSSVCQSGIFGMETVLLESGPRLFFSASVEKDGGVALGLFSIPISASGELALTELSRHFVTRALSYCAHFGGAVVVNADKQLFLSYGDRSQRSYVQDSRYSEGSIFRFNLRNNDFSSPQQSMTLVPDIFSSGHRNVQGLEYIEFKDKVVAAEHGPQGGDELNQIIEGENYGWPIVSLGEEYGGGVIGTSSKEGYFDPVLYFSPSIAPRELIYIPKNEKAGVVSNMLAFASLKFGVMIFVSLDSVRPDFRVLNGMDTRISGLEWSEKYGILFSTNDSKSRVGRILIY
jgi:glucose/arabinose dehydrogenase